MAYTKINKPGAQSYTNINTYSPRYNEASLTYDDATTFYNGINVSAYTKIGKPIFKAPSLVQSKKGYTGSTPLVITYTSQVTQGNLLVVCVSILASVDNITISDNQGHMWLKAINAIKSNGTPAVASIYYAVANGNTTPSITLGGTDVGGSIYEYAGLVGTLDSANSLILGITTTPTGTALRTSGPGIVIAMAVEEAVVNTFNASGSGFTLRNSNNSHVDAVSDFISANGGSYNCIFNATAATGWIVIQAAFSGVGVSTYVNIFKPT